MVYCKYTVTEMFHDPEKYSKTAKEILSTSEIMAAASDLIIKQFSTLLLE